MELRVRTFRMGTDKEAALKPLEEAAEAFGAWQLYDAWSRVPASEEMPEASLNNVDAVNMSRLADEIADCVQACCNLAARHRIDLQEALRRCEERNRARGRYE